MRAGCCRAATPRRACARAPTPAPPGRGRQEVASRQQPHGLRQERVGRRSCGRRVGHGARDRTCPGADVGRPTHGSSLACGVPTPTYPRSSRLQAVEHKTRVRQATAKQTHLHDSGYGCCEVPRRGGLIAADHLRQGKHQPLRRLACYEHNQRRLAQRGQTCSAAVAWGRFERRGYVGARPAWVEELEKAGLGARATPEDGRGSPLGRTLAPAQGRTAAARRPHGRARQSAAARPAPAGRRAFRMHVWGLGGVRGARGAHAVACERAARARQGGVCFLGWRAGQGLGSAASVQLHACAACTYTRQLAAAVCATDRSNKKWSLQAHPALTLHGAPSPWPAACCFRGSLGDEPDPFGGGGLRPRGNAFCTGDGVRDGARPRRFATAAAAAAWSAAASCGHARERMFGCVCACGCTGSATHAFIACRSRNHILTFVIVVLLRRGEARGELEIMLAGFDRDFDYIAS